MITYKQGQEYTLKVVNTNNEVKEIQYTPEKDMSKPEMIMALKSKYKNFFKLMEAKRIKADDLKIGDIYIDLSHNLQKVIDRPMPEKDLGITRKQLTKMFMPNKQNIKGTKWELEKIRPATKEDFENFPLIEAKQIDFGNGEEYTDYMIKESIDDDNKKVKIVRKAIEDKLKQGGYNLRYDDVNLETDENGNIHVIDKLTNDEVLVVDQPMLKKFLYSDIISRHRNKKLDELNSNIRYDFEEAYKDWGNEVSKTKSGFVNEYMSEFCNDFEEVNWRDYIVAIPEIDDIYAEYKNVEDWEIPEDVKLRQYELITNYVQNYLKGVYSKMEEAKSSGPVIVISYGRGTRFPDRKTAIEYYKECVAGTDPNGAENYSYQNILYGLMHTNKDVVYDIDDETEYDWWIQKGKPTDDISDELLKAHLEEDNNMKSEVNAEEFVKDIDTMKKLDIWDGKDSTYEKSKQKLKDIQDVNKELNVKEENSDIDEKVLANGFVGQPLSIVLSYTGDGHDIADRDYDCAVWFPPVDEIDDTDNYDLYMQALSQVLKVAERFDLDDDNIIVNISEYVKRNQDTLLDLFEVNGETEEEKFEDLVCRVMPLIISGYTTDNTYKLLLSGIKGVNNDD